MQPLIQFKQIEPGHEEILFEYYKSALKGVIDDSFGWDETFQRERFRSRYQADWFYWVEADGARVGYICFWAKKNEIHVSLLVIDKEKRRRGYGWSAMKRLHAEAKEKHFYITLSSFRKNSSAIKFYEDLGYIIVGEDEHFIDMKLNTP